MSVLPKGEFLAVLIPTRDGQLSWETHEALAWNSGGIPMVNIVERRKPVVEARNSLTEQCLGLRLPFRYVLWCDSDAWWPRGTLERMIQTLEQRADIDVLSAYSSDRMPLCCAGSFRMMNAHPVAIVSNVTQTTFPVPDEVRFIPNDVVEVDRVSFHFVMMRRSLLERLGPEPFNVPRSANYGEDFCFCERAQGAGAKIATDTAAWVAHVDIANGLAFLPHTRPGKINGGAFNIIDDPRSDLEIHAEWDEINIRAGRRYGERVDKILQDSFRMHVRNRRRQRERANL